jgi:hypothetical protein
MDANAGSSKLAAVILALYSPRTADCLSIRIEREQLLRVGDAA